MRNEEYHDQKASSAITQFQAAISQSKKSCEETQKRIDHLRQQHEHIKQTVSSLDEKIRSKNQSLSLLETEEARFTAGQKETENDLEQHQAQNEALYRPRRESEKDKENLTLESFRNASSLMKETASLGAVFLEKLKKQQSSSPSSSDYNNSSSSSTLLTEDAAATTDNNNDQKNNKSNNKNNNKNKSSSSSTTTGHSVLESNNNIHDDEDEDAILLMLQKELQTLESSYASLDKQQDELTNKINSKLRSSLDSVRQEIAHKEETVLKKSVEEYQQEEEKFQKIVSKYDELFASSSTSSASEHNDNNKKDEFNLALPQDQLKFLQNELFHLQRNQMLSAEKLKQQRSALHLKIRELRRDFDKSEEEIENVQKISEDLLEELSSMCCESCQVALAH